jgi:hypothetical protein
LFLKISEYYILICCTSINFVLHRVFLNTTLGTELDFTTGYIFNDVVSLQLGYSQFFTATTFEYLQGVGNPSSVQNWGYVALLVRPGMKNKFVGLMF